jgi:hypothetical protein
MADKKETLQKSISLNNQLLQSTKDLLRDTQNSHTQMSKKGSSRDALEDVQRAINLLEGKVKRYEDQIRSDEKALKSL